VSVAAQDLDLRYIWAYNQRTSRSDEIIGKRDGDIFTPAETKEITALKRRVLTEDIELRKQMWLERPGGPKFFDFYWEPLHDDAGRVSGVASTTVDLTPMKLAEEALQRAHEELQKHVQRLEETNKELESFSYTISHDLRAPLRAIDGFSDIIQKDSANSFDEETRRMFDVIRANAKKMGRLIDDLLAFSRAGRAAMNLSTIDMKGLVQEVLEQEEAANREYSFHVQLGELPPAYGDRTLVRQVLANLMENAIKFTRDKPDPRIEVGSYETGGGERVYYVKDNGVGFDMKYYDKLFGVFQRLVTDRQFEGTGVGLAIVHRLVSRHGGRVWAEGKLREGATFYFTLPRRGANS
jgi:light-regulated signal transduction histidine kinase (bacteriophytochrome)